MSDSNTDSFCFQAGYLTGALMKNKEVLAELILSLNRGDYDYCGRELLQRSISSHLTKLLDDINATLGKCSELMDVDKE